MTKTPADRLRNEMSIFGTDGPEADPMASDILAVCDENDHLRRLLDEFDAYASVGPGSVGYLGSPFARQVRAALDTAEHPARALADTQEGA